jgi:hypothetical protein
MEVKQVIKTIIEDKECPVHGLHPAIGTIRKEIKIITCCRAFHKMCSQQVQSILIGIDGAETWHVDTSASCDGKLMFNDRIAMSLLTR